MKSHISHYTTTLNRSHSTGKGTNIKRGFFCNGRIYVDIEGADEDSKLSVKDYLAFLRKKIELILPSGSRLVPGIVHSVMETEGSINFRFDDKEGANGFNASLPVSQVVVLM